MLNEDALTDWLVEYLEADEELMNLEQRGCPRGQVGFAQVPVHQGGQA